MDIPIQGVSEPINYRKFCNQIEDKVRAIEQKIDGISTDSDREKDRIKDILYKYKLEIFSKQLDTMAMAKMQPGLAATKYSEVQKLIRNNLDNFPIAGPSSSSEHYGIDAVPVLPTPNPAGRHLGYDPRGNDIFESLVPAPVYSAHSSSGAADF